MLLILASTSRYRAGLLERLQVPFQSVAPDVDETALADELPELLVERLSRTKAENVAGRYSHGDGALIIGSDQVAVQGDTVLGKPGTVARACAQLAQLSGREVIFLTGLCVLNTKSMHVRSTVVSTPVSFRRLSGSQIADYVDREMPLDCAGAFKSEGLGIALFDHIGGGDPSALIGLPLIELCSMLGAEGLEILG